MESGLITFFDVDECGFYRQKADPKDKNKRINEHVNSGLKETLDTVISWARKRDVSQTLPFCSKESPNRINVYFKDSHIDDETKDCLIVYCKELTNDDGKLNGFVSDVKVGNETGGVIQFEKKVNGKSLIYGSPMYFWYVPEKNLIASIKFPHSVVDSNNMCMYFKRAIENYIDTPNKIIHNSTQYNSALGRDISRKDVRYKSSCGKYTTKFIFSTKSKELTQGDISPEHLAPYITHLVVRDTISSQKKIENGFVFDLWNKVTKKSNISHMNKQIEIIEPVSVSAEELKSIISIYTNEIPESSPWNNIGFRKNNDDTTRWFGSYVDRRHIRIDPTLKTDSSFYSAKLLLENLKDVRANLLDFSGISSVSEYKAKQNKS